MAVSDPINAPFISLDQTADPCVFAFQVGPQHCVGPEGQPFLFGGATMGAGVSALEAACGRPLAWASAQYFGPARPGHSVTLSVSIRQRGQGITMAEAAVSSSGGLVARIVAALGTGREHGNRHWRRAPSVLQPEDLQETRHWRSHAGLHSHMEVRAAHGRYGRDRIGDPTPDGRLIFWIRPRSARIDKPYLAVVADFVPTGIGNALGTHSGGRSLDNNLRFVAPVETDWVLAEVAINAVENGLVHGEIALFSRDGVLMALGSQTLVLVHHTEKRRENISSAALRV
jgi:acyl-CoA thioesterase II